MRKTVISFIGLAAVAIALVSCDKEVGQKDNAVNASKGITVNVIAEDVATRTAVVDGEIPTVQWLDSDKISLIEIVDDEIKGIAESSSANIQDGKADFSTTLGWEASGSSFKYSAVYPAGSAYESSGKYYIYLPEEQYLNGNNFSDDSDILVSTVYDHGASRVEDGQPLMFTFRRLGTVVRLNLIGLSAGEKIQKIVFTGPDTIACALEYDPVTGTINPESAFYLNRSITLYLDDYESSGNGDPIWFRVLPTRDWGAGEEFSLEVWTETDIYKKEVTLTSALKFPDGGLTKLGVDISSSAIPPVAVPCLWDFDSGDAEFWTFIDNDGDGYNWFVSDNSGTHTYSGEYALTSASFINNVGALTPDDWAFTPKIQLTEGNYLSFWVAAQDLNWAAEHYAVYIAKGYPTGDLTELIDETEYPGGDYVEIGPDGYQHHIIQIPAEFDNEVVCIGFRHFNCTDMFRLDIDDVSVTEENPYTPPTANYEDYLGYWATSTEEVYTISEKENGVSYTVSGFKGQEYPVEAVFEDHLLVIYDQVVHTDGSDEIALQGLVPFNSSTYIYGYPVGENRKLLAAVYDDEQDVLTILPKSSYSYYVWLNYVDQVYTSYGVYDEFPDVLVPYVPDNSTVLFREDFEDGLSAWTLFDADGDGYNWELCNSTPDGYTHTGDYCLQGFSYKNGALDPDNYAYTPAITLTSNNYLRYWVRARSNSWPEHYGIYITTSAPAASIDACELLVDKSTESDDYLRYEVAIPSSYDGKTVYILFRHFDSKDNYFLYIDDVSVVEKQVDDSSSSPSPAPKKLLHAAGKFDGPEMRKDQRPSKEAGIPIRPKILERR